MQIGVAGIAGRMGRVVAEEIVAAGAMLTGGTCPLGETPPPGVIGFASLRDLAAGSRAIIDFTHASTVPSHAEACMDAHTAWILGTTGLSPEDQAAVCAAARRIAVVQAANFSPGVNLVLALARTLGAALPGDAYDAEIVEMHHRQKVDAPSGTALALGRAVAAGRGARFEDVVIPARDGHTGPRPAGGIGFAALRGGQVVGEHTLIFAAGDEQIALTHRAFDRRAFARGAVRAALWAAGRPPGLYGMMDVLGMQAAPGEAAS
jgi:4-hydroxy-tetrahydrodipicolinate reductase